MPNNENKPRILTHFEIGWIYGWDSDIEGIYQEQFNNDNKNDHNNKKEKDID